MKICIASSGLGHTARGIEAWAEDLANALANRGEQVNLYKGAGKSNADFEQVLPCWTRNSIIGSQCDRMATRYRKSICSRTANLRA